jgi:predicted ATP-grasp superfamily ATP-dependent carboligase
MLNSQDAHPILLIGSNVRFLAENATHHGREVFTVDYYGDWDTKRLSGNRSIKREGSGALDLRELMKLAAGVENSGVVYGPGFENDLMALARLSDLGRVIGCSLETVKKTRDPYSLARAATAWNFSYPKIFTEPADSMRAERWLIKPLASLGGSGIRFVDDSYRPGMERVYYQKFHSGMPSSAIVVSNGSEAALVAVMTQIHGDPSFGADGFKFVGNVFPHPFTKEITNSATTIAEALTLEFDLKGLWGFDFIYGEGVTLIEINPRPTSSLGLLDMATWNDLLGLHIDSAGGKKSNLILDPGPTGRYFAQGRVYAKTDTVFTGSQAWSERGARDIPYEGDFINAGEPVITVTASDTTYSGALARLRKEACDVQDSISPATTTPFMKD